VTILSLAEDRAAAIREAGLAVRAGDVIVFPTDTVYGIAANAFDQTACARIFEIKKRPRTLPLPVLVSRPRQAWALCAAVPPAASELVARFWPGGLTLILPQAPELDWDLGDANGTIALRMPAHDDLIALLESTGPLAATSANLSGEPTPPTVHEVAEKLGDSVAVYVDGGVANSDVGSTIVDLTGPVARIVREGVIPASDIVEAIG
jgi:tRNA threonylcarbamoyl adenosine modification protein (Sua5/YciO/YrdC/YwlC family)